MPQFLYRIKLAPKYREATNRDQQFDDTISDHFNYLKNLCEKGVVLMAGRTDVVLEDPNNHGICIFEAESLEAAQTFTNNDPAIKTGIMIPEVYPFSLALWKKS